MNKKTLLAAVAASLMGLSILPQNMAHADTTYVSLLGVCTATRPLSDYGDALAQAVKAHNELVAATNQGTVMTAEDLMKKLGFGNDISTVNNGTIAIAYQVSGVNNEISAYNETWAAIVNAGVQQSTYAQQAMDIAAKIGVKKEAVMSLGGYQEDFARFFATYSGDTKPSGDQLLKFINTFNAMMTLRATMLNFEYADHVQCGGTSVAFKTSNIEAAGFSLRDNNTRVIYDASAQGGVIGGVGSAQKYLGSSSSS